MATNKNNQAPEDDVALVQRCLDGDKQAWVELVNRYRRLIYSVPVKLGMKPDHEHANLRAAECSERLGNAIEAEARLRSLIRTVPGSVRGYETLAGFLAARNRTEEARRVLREGLARTGGDSTLAARLRALAP